MKNYDYHKLISICLLVFLYSFSFANNTATYTSVNQELIFLDSIDPIGIGGYILTETGKPVPDVGFKETDVSTSETGCYKYPEAPQGMPYTSVTPCKDINYYQGVNVFDLALIRLHILAFQPLDSPYKLIAADINNDGNVTTFDQVELQRLLLQVTTSFPSNTSWRFIEKSYEFITPENPWENPPASEPFESTISDTLTEDFVGIKIGDLNDSAFELEEPEDSLFFTTANIAMETGQSYQLDFKATNFNDISAYQLSFNYDATAIDVISYESPLIGNNFHRATSTIITNLFSNLPYGSISHTEEEVLFSVMVEAKKDLKVSEVINFEPTLVQGLAVTHTLSNSLDVENLDLLGLDLVFTAPITSSIRVDTNPMVLYQNQPNPFRHSTTVSFELPAAEYATLNIYDASGKLVKRIDGDYPQGLNHIQIHQSDLPAKGVFYYQLNAGRYSSSKRMLVL